MSSREQYAPGALALSPTGLSVPRSKGIVIGFWAVREDDGPWHSAS